MPEPRDTEWRCPEFETGLDGRPNQCALSKGHGGPHRNRSGRLKWTASAASRRLMANVRDPQHVRFGQEGTDGD